MIDVIVIKVLVQTLATLLNCSGDETDDDPNDNARRAGICKSDPTVDLQTEYQEHDWNIIQHCSDKSRIFSDALDIVDYG